MNEEQWFDKQDKDYCAKLGTGIQVGKEWVHIEGKRAYEKPRKRTAIDGCVYPRNVLN